jgi:hypothetical protein
LHLDDKYVFTSLADAVEQMGFLIICKKAVSFVADHYGCSAKINLTELKRGHAQWVDLAFPLPLNEYRPGKRELLTIATLIEALADTSFVHYSGTSSDAPPLLQEFPSQATAVVMGIILYDIVLRTRTMQTTEIRYIDLDRIAGDDMHQAVSALHERRSRKYKFRRLLSILEMFSTPIVFH